MEFRISVCLSRYFEDERSFCYMMVEQREERVAALERRLRALFRLRGSFCLMSRDHYLPPDEKLAVLGPDDTVTIVPLEKDWWTDEDQSPAESKCKSEPEDAEPSVDDPPAPATSAGDKSIKKKKKKKIKSESMNGNGEETAAAPAVRIDDAEVSSADAEPMEHSDGTGHALSQLKLKALSLLQEMTGKIGTVAGPAGGISGGRVTKRRRVRRRNRRASAAGADSPFPSRSPTPVTPESDSSVRTRVLAGDEPPSTPDSHRATFAPTSTPKPPPVAAPPGPSSLTGPTPAPALSQLSGPMLQPTHMRFPSESSGPPAVVQNAGAGAGARGRLVRPEAAQTVSVAALQQRLQEFPVMDALTYPMPNDLLLFKTVHVSGLAARSSGGVVARVLRVDKTAGSVALRVLDGAAALTAAGREPSPAGDIVLPWAAVLDPRLIFL